MLSKFVPLKNNGNHCRREGEKRDGFLSIVCSRNNGKRLMLSPQLCKELEIDSSIQLSIMEGYLLVKACNPEDKDAFLLKQQGKKKVLYSAEIVRTIAEQLELDFANKVSYTFFNVKLDEFKGQTVAKFRAERSED